MANYSQYKNLELPISTEHYNINVFNQNNQIIDEELHKLDVKNEEQDATLRNLSNVENKSSEQIRNEITRNNVTNALGYTPYTPTEVDNKFSSLETRIDWKEAVETYEDIEITYPEPEDGWTVNVKDTNYTYRYNGEKWISISANAIPKATNEVDGLLSKEDHTKYNNLIIEMTNLKKSVSDGKTLVAEAITEKGVETAADASFQEMSDNIRKISNNNDSGNNSSSIVIPAVYLYIYGNDNTSNSTLAGAYLIDTSDFKHLTIDKIIASGLNVNTYISVRGYNRKENPASIGSAYMFFTPPSGQIGITLIEETSLANFQSNHLDGSPYINFDVSDEFDTIGILCRSINIVRGYDSSPYITLRSITLS